MSDTVFVGREYIVPVRRPFPVWCYDPIHWGADDLPDAWGWVPHPYGFPAFASLEEAEAFRGAMQRPWGRSAPEGVDAFVRRTRSTSLARGTARVALLL